MIEDSVPPTRAPRLRIVLLVGALCAVAGWAIVRAIGHRGAAVDRPDSANVRGWRAADSARMLARADVPTMLAAIRRRAIEDTALHLAIEVDSGRMYLERDGVVLRAMPAHIGFAADSLAAIARRGSQWIATVAPDTIALNDGTLIYAVAGAGEGGGAAGDSLVDSARASSGNVRVRSRDLEAIAPAIQSGMTADFYDVRRGPGTEGDTLERPYIVVSIADHRLWYRRGEQTIFATRVATGTGKELVKEDSGEATWKFDTPRGRLVVIAKETDPEWVPPDWHYVELARDKHLGLVKLMRGRSIAVTDSAAGTRILVDGHDVVTRFPDGHEEPFEVSDGKEIVANDQIVIPPYGTNQRRYTGTLGVYRLYLGDGYGLHGTDEPNSIGQSASHGCVRLRNEDIETLYRLVPRGTVVYIY